MGSLGWKERGKRGQPRTLRRILWSDFLWIKSRDDKWVLSQFLHVWDFFEQLLDNSSISSPLGTSANGARRLISSLSLTHTHTICDPELQSSLLHFYEVFIICTLPHLLRAQNLMKMLAEERERDGGERFKSGGECS